VVKAGEACSRASKIPFFEDMGWHVRPFGDSLFPFSEKALLSAIGFSHGEIDSEGFGSFFFESAQ